MIVGRIMPGFQIPQSRRKPGPTDPHPRWPKDGSRLSRDLCITPEEGLRETDLESQLGSLDSKVPRMCCCGFFPSMTWVALPSYAKVPLSPGLRFWAGWGVTAKNAPPLPLRPRGRRGLG